MGCDSAGVKSRKIKERVIILGFDAVSPWLLRRYISEGHLPNLKALAEEGSFTELKTSIPPESPVAWSTFSVSAQAGVHGIYDFLNRDLKTYTPRIASVKPEYPRFLWDFIPLGGPKAVSLQTGKPFWKHAAEHGVKSAMLEAPVAFPAYEVQAESILLSGLTTPDLRGTQATYHFFTTDIYSESFEDTEFGGKVSALEFDNDHRAQATVYGPWNPVTRQKRIRLLDKRNKLAALILLTLPGTPLIYYGEEVGMTGMNPPDEAIRTPMDWNMVARQRQDPRSLLDWYRRLIRLRTLYPALTTRDDRDISSYKELKTGHEHVYAFLRLAQGADPMIVVVNFSDLPVERCKIRAITSPLAQGRYAVTDLLSHGPSRECSNLQIGPNGRFSGYRPHLQLEPETGYLLKAERMSETKRP